MRILDFVYFQNCNHMSLTVTIFLPVEEKRQEEGRKQPKRTRPLRPKIGHSKMKQAIRVKFADIRSNARILNPPSDLEAYKISLEKYILNTGDRHRAIGQLVAFLSNDNIADQRRNALVLVGQVVGMKAAEDLIKRVLRCPGCLFHLLAEAMRDRGKLTDLLHAAAFNGSFVAFEELCKCLPNTQAIYTLIEAYQQTNYEASLYLGTHLKFIRMFPRFWDLVFRQATL